MSEFCTNCADRLGMVAEIDFQKIISDLLPDHYIHETCEGCGYFAIEKDEDGLIWLHKHKDGQVRYFERTDLV